MAKLLHAVSAMLQRLEGWFECFSDTVRNVYCCMGQATDQARRISQLEESLAELRLRPTPRRAGPNGEVDPVSTLEAQVGKLTEELQART